MNATFHQDKGGVCFAQRRLFRLSNSRICWSIVVRLSGIGWPRNCISGANALRQVGSPHQAFPITPTG